MAFEFLHCPKRPLARIFHVARALFHACVRGHDVRVHLTLGVTLLFTNRTEGDVGKRFEVTQEMETSLIRGNIVANAAEAATG